MQLISALSLQMPWMTLHEFESFTSEGLESEAVSEQSKKFLRTNKSKAIERAERLIESCESSGIQILFPGHPLYPIGCLELEDPPMFLSLEGAWPNIPSVAIVGSREPSRLAVDWINDNLPLVLDNINCLIISGGARGIDLTAHLAAVRKGKPTLVFLPCGLNNFYPKDLCRYKELILECGGGFVSEFAPETEMRKFHFIKRNRLIVASSDVVFVAEARRKSGSMLTANIATGMHKAICTLPASPSMSCAQGNLDLIFNGISSIRDHLDLLTTISLSSKHALV